MNNSTTALDGIYANDNVKLSPVKRLFRMLSLDRREILIVYIYAIFSGLINLSLPLGVQAIIGFVIGAEYSASLGLLIFIVVVGVAVVGIIQILQISLTEMLQRRIFTRASFEFAYRIPRFKMSAVQGMYTPELVNRFFDTLNVQKGLSKVLIDISTSTLQILFGLILLALYHPFFVAFGVILIALMALIFIFSGRRGLKTSLLESKYKYQVAHWLEELARVMMTFKLTGNSDLPIKKMNEYVGNYLKFRKQHFSVLIFQFSNIVAFKTIITAGLLILGSALVINQEINLGQFVASEIIILLVLTSAEKLILSMETVYDVLTGLDKLGQVTDIPLESEEGLRQQDIPDTAEVILEASNVTYTYPGAVAPVLKNINLAIKRGEKVCITGMNESGKSTFLSLVSALYDCQQGSLLYNGIPYSNMSLEDFRTHIGDNLSQQNLFSGTLAENISVGVAGVSVQDMLKALESVGLLEFFKDLPKGLHTVIQPEGQGLSKSAIQKILLARTIVGDPKLIVIDDALQGIYFEDRQKIAQMLTGPEHDWTLIAVTNDPLLLSSCDRIITMEEGEIVDDRKNLNDNL